MEEEKIYLPVLHWFAMTNLFTGSCGAFRFRVEPSITMATPKEVDFEQSSMKAEFWHGDLCYELSRMEGERVFPLSEEGKQEMKEWLESNI